MTSSNVNSALADKQKELDEKLKNFKGGEEYKQQVDKLLSEKDALLKQVADLEPLKGLDEKYKSATETLSGLKKEVAYGQVKPSFPDSVNKFEADAKWNAFKANIEEKYNLEIVDGKAIVVDKENPHKQYELATLVGQDETLTQLLQGRQQRGTGASPVDLKEVEGVPFKIPANATSEDISNLVREHVLKEVKDLTHPEYAKKFQELYSKIKKAA